MKYNYNTTKTSAISLRNAGNTLDEIALALGITTGIAKDMVKNAVFSKSLGKNAVDRNKANYKKRLSTSIR